MQQNCCSKTFLVIFINVFCITIAIYSPETYTNMKRKVEDSVTDVVNVEETANRKKKVRFEEHKAKDSVTNVKSIKETQNDRKKKIKFEKPLNNKVTGEKEKLIFYKKKTITST